MSSSKDLGTLNLQNNRMKLKFNGKQTAESLIRIAFDVIKGNLGAGTIPSIKKSFGLKRDLESLVNQFVYKSLIDAFREQIRAELDQAYIDKNKQLVFNNKVMDSDAYELLKSNDYSITLYDFKRPENLTLLTDFREAYQQWLQDSFGMSPSRAKGLGKVFKSYFAEAFYEELRNDAYDDIRKWRKDTTFPEQRATAKRALYNDQLEEYYYKPTLGQQDVALADIYIEPNFRILDHLLTEKQQKQLRKKKENKNSETKRLEHFLKTSFKGSLHDYFLDYFLPQSKSSALDFKKEYKRMMVLLGQPGHGKSSFCYRVAYDLLTKEAYNFRGNVGFIRLRNIECNRFKAGPLEVLSKQLKSHGFDLQADLEAGEQASVILLDGLDELKMSQRLSDQEVKEFLEDCEQLVQDYEQLHIVVTSRFNYIPSDKLQRLKAVVMSLSSLDFTQQEKLIKRYANQKGENPKIDASLLKKINEENKHKYLKELIELPILLQMILLGDVSLQDTNSRAAIYKKLFDFVLERKWEGDQARLEKIVDPSKFKPIYLRHYLAFLAHKIYQSPYESLDRMDIKGYPETEKFIRQYLVEGDETEQMDQMLKDVLTSFYLKEKRKATDEWDGKGTRQHYAVEFLHKSLYEYLACEHLWNEVKSIFLDRDDAAEYLKFNAPGIGERIQQLFANTRLSDELLGYLKEIIDLDADCHGALQEAMKYTLPSMLSYGCLHKYHISSDTPPQRFTPHQQALHTFHCYWAILGHLQSYKIKPTDYFNSDWQDFYNKQLKTISIDELIKEYGIPDNYETEVDFRQEWAKNTPNKLPLLIQVYYRRKLFIKDNNALRPKWKDTVTNQLISWMRAISAERLSFRLDFKLSNFSRKGFRGLVAANIDLSGAGLSGADLSGAYLSGAYLSGADLSGADLSGADLSRADLRRAYLSRADLSGAYLSGADLSGADLHRAYLSGADLHQAYLSGADLHQAYLRGAYLSRAYLSRAYLSGADLRGADLSRADLRGADLRGADLSGADLSRADLSRAILSSRIQLDDLEAACKKDIFDRYEVSKKLEEIKITRWDKVKGYRILEKKKE